MAFPPGYHVTEIKNAIVGDPTCESTPISWIAGYNNPQDFHIEVDVPDTSPGVKYGLNQTLLLAIRTALYQKNDDGDIQLWRTPPQNTPFDFKGHWIDSKNSGSNNSTLPYYSDEAVAETKLKDDIDGKDAYHITLRMQKSPKVQMPTQIRRKSKQDEKLTLKQFDVQEMYLLSLFRDEDAKNAKEAKNKRGAPLVQWTWEYKYAWVPDESGNPKLVTNQGLQWARKCTQKDPAWKNYALEGQAMTSGGHYDHFRTLNPDYRGGPVGEVSEWVHPETDEWESCDS